MWAAVERRFVGHLVGELWLYRKTKTRREASECRCWLALLFYLLGGDDR